ncbi:hypothetical protein [Streptomyces sp. SAJ15]|uniref:hypothetical protein n=1 Tax=Streptomyces sp. SAJ15 TaxID=2011095 RepID=UPI001642FCC8|nr:hypothetical protein [Streptomyces sp. SAJ15]
MGERSGERWNAAEYEQPVGELVDGIEVEDRVGPSADARRDPGCGRADDPCH